MASMARYWATDFFVGTPPGTSSVSSRCIRFNPCALAWESSSRRSQSIRSTTSSSSVVNSRNPVSRNATITTAWASVTSVLRPCPVSNTRARAASLAGTSSTRSPSASSRCASGRPVPFAPSIAQIRSGHCRATCRNARYPSVVIGNVPTTRSTSRVSRASNVTDRLCGSTPMITRSITAASSSPRTISGQRGRATLLRAEQTLLEPRLAAVPGQAARHGRATPQRSGWAADRESVRPGTYPQTDRPASLGQ